MPKVKYKSEASKLCSAIQASRQAQQFGRVQHMEASRLYAGDQWSEETRLEKTYVNFLALYADIVMRNIVGKNTRLMLSTFARSQKPVVSTLQRWSNSEFERMNFSNIMKQVGFNGLFSGGFCSVSLANPLEAALRGDFSAVGKPTIQHHDRDDVVWDHHAREWDECDYRGFRFRAPLEAAQEWKVFGKARKDLIASVDSRFNTQGDERISVLGRGYWGDNEEYHDKVDLWCIECPREKKIFFLAEDALTGAHAPAHGGEPDFLGEQPWIGHETGMMKCLALGNVPGNAAPKGPIMNLLNLHRTANRILGKLIWSGINLKEVLFAPRGAAEDIERVRTSSHGDIIPSDQAKNFATVAMNVPNNMLIQFFMLLKDLFSWAAGNLDILGGLSAQAKTLGQEKISNQNASGGIADMQDRMLNFTSDVARSFLWYPWHDSKLVMPATYSPQGLPDVAIDTPLYPWDNPDPLKMKRSGNWEDIHCKIDPYTMGHSTPQQRSAMLRGFIKEVWAPLAGLAAQQGVVLSFDMVAEKLGAYDDMPDLKEIFTQHDPPEQPPGGGGPQQPQQPGQPAPEETEHVRTNIPGRTEQGTMRNMLQSLSGVDAGGDPKPKPMNGTM